MRTSWKPMRTTTATTRRTTSTESLIKKWQTSTSETIQRSTVKPTESTATFTSTLSTLSTATIPSSTPTVVMEPESEMSDSSSAMLSNEAPIAVPQVNESPNDEGGSSTVVIGVSIFFLILILSVVTVSGLFVYRRKRINSEGAVSFDKNKKTEPDQIDGGNAVTNITFLDDNGDTSHLHEFFPPSMQTSS